MGKKLAFCLALLVSAAHAQTATATPAKLTFTYQLGGTMPASQTVNVKLSSGGPLYAAAVVLPPGTNPGTILWATVSPTTAKTPATFTVYVNPTGLQQNTYSAQLLVTPTGLTAISIPISLTITAPLPTLTLGSTTLNLATPSNLSTSVTLTTTGTPVTFTGSVTGTSWLTMSVNGSCSSSLSSVSGIVLPGGPFSLTVCTDPTGLTPQAKAYSGKISIVASGVPAANKTQIITVNFTVSSTKPVITNLQPNTVQPTSQAQTIWIYGQNFFSGSTVKAGNTSLTPIVITPGSCLQVVVPGTLLTNPGTLLNILVTNPLGGGDSDPSILQIANWPAVTAVLNAANYSSGTVSPGELVTIFGQGIGPANPLYMSVSGGWVDPMPGGMTVWIGGSLAPVLYADANQVTVQVPYGLTPGQKYALIVQDGSISAIVPASLATLTIATYAPGVFTADGTGSGQAAADVYSGTTGLLTGLNSSTNPAHASDIVVIYLTGEGDYLAGNALIPASHTGYIIPTSLTATQLLSLQMSTPPTITIGGIAAPTISYAGPILGSVTGLLQLNILVPSGIAAGDAPIAITFGSGATAVTVNSATLAVK